MKMLFFIFLGLLHTTAVHEFYVGITEIRYAENSQSYQITLKLFTDDLEDAIYNDSGDRLDLGNENEFAQSDTLIFNYLKKHFNINDSENNIVPLNNIGRETQLDVTWIYLESKKMKPQDGLSITNDIFMEIHPEQTHVINLIQEGITKSALLHSTHKAELLEP